MHKDFDFVTADNATKPHVSVVCRTDIGDGIAEETLAVFFVSKELTLSDCEDLAYKLVNQLIRS